MAQEKSMGLSRVARVAGCGLILAMVQATANAADDLEEVVVVGSRIRRELPVSASPVQVVTREQSIAAGYSTTTDLLQSPLIAAGASQIDNAYGGFVTDGGPGANTLSLRSLGATRTLVLINGRRVSPAGSRGAVGAADLNVLPSALVERIEVLGDGASSIYGSDAIAGVVNVITRQQLSGLTVEGQYNRPFEQGGEQSRVGLSAGAGGQGWQLNGSLEFFSRGRVTLAQRDWTRCAQDNLRDPATGETLDYIDPLTGAPRCYPITGTGSNGVTVNTIGTPSRPGVPAVGTAGASFNRWRPNPAVTTGVVGFEGVSGAGGVNVRDTFEPRMLNQDLISPEKVWTGFVQGAFDLGAAGGAQLYLETLLSHRTSNQVDYRQLLLDYRFGSIRIPANLVFPTAAMGVQDGGMTGTDPVGIRAFIGAVNDRAHQQVDYLRPVVGIRGELPLRGWRYDGYVGFSKSSANYYNEAFLTDRLTRSSDVIASPVGLDAALNFGGVTCRINTVTPAENCVPLPPLNAQTIAGQLPRSWMDYVFRDIAGSTSYREWVASAYFDGPLMQLPAGDVQAVVGGEYRRARIDDSPSPQAAASNLYNLTNAGPTRGRDQVGEFFVEVEAPLLRDLPLARALTLNASFRQTDYDSYGSGSTYKFGLVYRPTGWMSLHATTGTSYRAPALFEQFQGPIVGFISGTIDPCNNYGAKSAILRANCATQIPNPDFLATLSVAVAGAGGAAGGLKAETSDNLTAGILFQPALGELGELGFGVDFFDIRIDNGVSQVGAPDILRLCYDDPSFNPAQGYCRLVSRGTTAPYRLSVRDEYTNLATEISRGFDFHLDYEGTVGPGRLGFTGRATHYRKQAKKLFDEDPLDELTGTIFYPDWVWSLGASYALGRWRLGYGIDATGAMDSTEYLGEDPEDTIYDFHTRTWITHRVSLRYRKDGGGQGWEVTAGVRNLFDRQPPSISSGQYNRMGNAPLYSGFDYLGRTAFLSLSRQF